MIRRTIKKRVVLRDTKEGVDSVDSVEEEAVSVVAAIGEVEGVSIGVDAVVIEVDAAAIGVDAAAIGEVEEDSEVVVEVSGVVSITENHGVETIRKEVDPTDLGGHGVTAMVKGVVAVGSEGVEVVSIETDRSTVRRNKIRK